MDTLPRLGDPAAAFARLGPATRLATSRGFAGNIAQYASHLGPLTVLFEQGQAVALHLRYQTSTPHTAELRAQVKQLAVESGAVRLLVDDAGWFLVSPACSEAGQRQIQRVVLPAERLADLGAWEQLPAP
jgi:hypothetical protein